MDAHFLPGCIQRSVVSFRRSSAGYIPWPLRKHCLTKGTQTQTSETAQTYHFHLDPAGGEPSPILRRTLLTNAAVLGMALNPLPAQAGLSSYNITPGSAIQEVNISLSNAQGDLLFTPKTLELIAGQIYKLNMTNPSDATHYFTALEFADKIYTILVLAGNPAVEVKGKVQEVALKKGASATWIFIPIKPGTYPLKCTVKGHAEGGMVGTIVVKPPAAAAS